VEVQDDVMDACSSAQSSRRKRAPEDEDWTPGGANRKSQPKSGERKCRKAADMSVAVADFEPDLRPGITLASPQQMDASDDELTLKASSPAVVPPQTQEDLRSSTATSAMSAAFFNSEEASAASRASAAAASTAPATVTSTLAAGSEERLPEVPATVTSTLGACLQEILPESHVDELTMKSSLASASETGPSVVKRGCSKPIVTIERAKTARAVCRACGQSIQGGVLRCGLEIYGGGRMSMQWAHAECFLEKINAEYVTARRGKCKGSGTPFNVGDIRVGFAVGGSRLWFSVPEAARWTQQLTSELGKQISTVGGLEELDEDHREALLAQLKGSADLVPLRRAHAARTTRAGSAGESRGVLRDETPPAVTQHAPAAISTSQTPVAPESVPLPAAMAAEDSGSDVEVEYGAGLDISVDD
jgi:hypothetical protein